MPTLTLTERYVDAAMRTVPEHQRDDLSRELRALIDDQIDARIETGESETDAERAVLTGLGDPDILAAGYIDRRLQLIGPKYYLHWWRLLKLLLWIVVPCAVFGIALGLTISGAAPGSIVGSTIGMTISVIVHLCFWTTAVFAMMEYWEGRTGQSTALDPWTLERLPEPRVTRVGLAELITQVSWFVIAAGAILWDHFLGFIPDEQISFLHPGLWPWWIAGLFVIMAIDVCVSVMIYLGGWNWGLAATRAVLNLAVAVPALWLLATGNLVNPEFWATVLDDAGQNAPGIMAIITGFVIVGITVWSIIDAFLRAGRARSAC